VHQLPGLHTLRQLRTPYKRKRQATVIQISHRHTDKPWKWTQSHPPIKRQ
jgi:hypothetical protein